MNPVFLNDVVIAAAGGVLWRASWQGAIALLLVGVLCRLFPKLPAAARCWLWRLALLKFLVALVGVGPLSLPLLPAPTPAIIASAAPSEKIASPAVRRAESRDSATRPAPNAMPDTARASEPPSPIGTTEPPSLLLPLLLTLVYLTGVVWGIVRVLRAWGEAQRLYREARPLEDTVLTDQAAVLSARLGMRALPRLRVSSEIRTPLLTAVPRAAILLPEGTTESNQTLRLMLAHELAHLKRRDLFWNGLGAFVQTLFFFHPLVFLARREDVLAREIACDALALRITEVPAADYGAMLVRAATGQEVRPAPLVAAGAVMLGIADSLGALKKRLLAMQDAGTMTRRWRLVTAALLGAVIVGLVPWRVIARDAGRQVRPEADGRGHARVRRMGERILTDYLGGFDRMTPNGMTANGSPKTTGTTLIEYPISPDDMATIHGTVQTPDGKPLVGAEVSSFVWNIKRAQVYHTTQTNERGEFALTVYRPLLDDNLPAGYSGQLAVTAPGYSIAFQSFSVPTSGNPGPSSSLRIQMSPQPGFDAVYLNSPLSNKDPKAERTNMLPLKPGNWWDMHAVCAGAGNEDRYVVVGPVTNEGDVSGIEVDQIRNGKRWRREIFQQKGDTLYVCAMQDETSQLMRYDPPIPILKEPVSEGDTIQWYGEFQMGNETLPARALSRISGKESVTTATGKFKTFRVDTIVRVTRSRHEIKFPTVRWLAARVGYVRRGYADKGRPAFSEVKKFNVQ